jgi:hypothetical protein
VSVGKRRLSDSTDNAPSNAKAPRFDSSVVLGQLKTQEDLLVEVKDVLGTMDYDTVLGQVLPQQVKDVIVGMATLIWVMCPL